MSCRSPLPHFLRCPLYSLNHTQKRCVRTKRGSNPYDTSLRRDERLLKRLEAQLSDVREKIKREEEEAAGLLKQNKKRRNSAGSPALEDLPSHSALFWDKVLSKDDRNALESYGINSLDDLSSVYDAVRLKLSRPPHPKIESLDPKSRCAYNTYQSIPTKLREAGRSKAGSWLGSWF